MSDLIQKGSTAIDMARMKVVSIIGRLKHYPKSLTVEMRDQAAGVIEEYLARDDERLRSVGNLLEAADKAMAGATTSDAKLMVMANYGDIALGILRGFAEGRPFTPTLTEETARLKERVRVLEERLKPFAEVAEHIALSPGFAKHYMHINLGLMNGNVVQSLIEWKLTVEDFRRARSALHTTPEVGE